MQNDYVLSTSLNCIKDIQNGKGIEVNFFDTTFFHIKKRVLFVSFCASLMSIAQINFISVIQSLPEYMFFK